MIARTFAGKVPWPGPSALSRRSVIRSMRILKGGAGRLDWNHVRAEIGQKVCVIQRRLTVHEG